MTETIEVDTDDGPMPLVVARPSGAPRGGVVVVQEVFGLTPYVHRVCERLAGAGWLAVAPALFHRQGSPAFAPDELDRAREVLATLDEAGLATDLDATLRWLHASGIEPLRCGVVGFCMGGTVACWSAIAFELGAAVTFYGGGVTSGRFGLPSLVEAAPALRAPWLGLYGDLDAGIPVGDVEALRAALVDAPVDWELHRYPDAGHGFHNDERDAHHPASADDAWARTSAWFERYLAAG